MSEDLLLPYRLESRAGSRAATDLEEPGTRLRLVVGGPSETAVLCSGFTLSLPVDPATRQAPHLRGAPVRGRGRGRHWWITADRTDPAVLRLECVPDEPATFDGAWSVEFEIDLAAPVGSEVARISERAAAGASALSTRTAHVPITPV
ncbi:MULTISPECIES: hypothetical protein [Actinosynnema]|uniref:hypothetical protein n=1 Tax=Actinosynnema TaxID=40566 RepID=UPI0020A353A7|nr:hypothetical protein [Actinosynnema pretiosum]MCP2098793.1 hypothetical protein [Actinosynnema pretiosum]